MNLLPELQPRFALMFAIHRAIKDGWMSWRRARSEIGCTQDELTSAFLAHRLGDPRSIEGDGCVCPRIVASCSAPGCPRAQQQSLQDSRK